MQQLLLSSNRLGAQKVLSTGSINVFEQLQKNANSAIVLDAKIPKGDLILEWKEVTTPATSTGLVDLVGKKLATYKFQYLGQFSYNGEVINPVGEQFVAGFDSEKIHDATVSSEGWVNCTWLVDFMMNNKEGQHEKISWRKEEGGFVLAMSTEATDYTSAEQQKISFSKKYTELEWKHQVLFAR